MSAPSLETFVATWSQSSGAERANKDSFLAQLCEVLDVPRPDPTTGDAARDQYVFEKDAPFVFEGGAKSIKKIDLYKAGHFILEAKQGSELGAAKLGTAKRGTPGWSVAMNDAFGQALGYSKSFDQAVPFLVVCDIGHCFDLYADFSGSWQYRPFPNAQQHRIYLKDLLTKPALVDRLRLLFTDPYALDPSKHAAKVTREVAAHLAELAKKLETDHGQVPVARFLMRCLFTMFAEDVGLLPDRLFTQYLRDYWLKSPASFPGGIESLWRAMNDGGNLPTAKLLRFNGGLFVGPTGLDLDEEALQLLLKAAECDWSDVEPAIFGTLLERALDPEERHRLGAHFTPRAYVERLVKPTIEEPLREEWDQIRIEVRTRLKDIESVKGGARTKKLNEATKLARDFHHRLLALRILDPACGTGNFLYVAMDVLKRLESEVLALIADINSGDQDLLHIEHARISPEQFLGIEIKPWAKEIADLVLWIGYLQWHFRQYGKTVSVPEPVLRDYKNIECRDAVLAYDSEELDIDLDGKPKTRWDGKSMKIHPVTGKEVPDETRRVPLYKYVNPRKAEWPKADFIVGNPPFVGNKRMREALGDGYVDELRGAYSDMPETADLVMYWWHQAGLRLKNKACDRFGFITTNSITQSQQRPIVQNVLGGGSAHFVFAVADHPWVESDTGAAVRIAMSVLAPGDEPGVLARVVAEKDAGGDHPEVVLDLRSGPIEPDFRIGAAVASAKSLAANRGLSFMGITLVGKGFRLDRSDLSALGLDAGSLPRVVRPYRSGKELTDVAQERWVIDFFGMAQLDAQGEYPLLYQHLLDTVFPLRKENKRESYRTAWHVFGEPRGRMRAALEGLPRFIATLETSKHRVFQFLPGDTLADHTLFAIASSRPEDLGVLSSRAHVAFAAAAGSRMGVGNDSRWRNLACFDPFPFPDFTDASRERIGALGEALDAHRKKQQAQYPELTITGMYNVLEKLRAEEPLCEKEKKIHEQGLVSILKQIHDDLDRAVFEAYGWPETLTDEEILERLVALNRERADEEKRGLVRWLRPEFQNPSSRPAAGPAQTSLALGEVDEPEEDAPALAATARTWPKKLSERVAAVRDLVTPGSQWSEAEVVRAFPGATADQVSEVLESLGALGMLVLLESPDGAQWAAPRAASPSVRP